MQIIFRVDASLQMGTGHVMRCLTLAQALRDRGADCRFLCREHPGHLLQRIRDLGFEGVALPLGSDSSDLDEDVSQVAHAAWLGTNWQSDADQTMAALGEDCPDWLVVDHYALDHRWESKLRPHCGKIMVIDDLADRYHDCDLLMDQTFERQVNEYINFVPNYCHLLLGSKYALLRPEFSQLRQKTLERYPNRENSKLLISFGGGNNEYWILKVLESLSQTNVVENGEIHILLGNVSTLFQEKIKKLTIDGLKISFENFTVEMAKWMIWADIAIGAAGSTSWERCCMALPSVLLILEENQRQIGHGLAKSGAAICIDVKSDFHNSFSGAIKLLLNDTTLYGKMSRIASEICDGQGVNRVVKCLLL